MGKKNPQIQFRTPPGIEKEFRDAVAELRKYGYSPSADGEASHAAILAFSRADIQTRLEWIRWVQTYETDKISKLLGEPAEDAAADEASAAQADEQARKGKRKKRRGA